MMMVFSTVQQKFSHNPCVSADTQVQINVWFTGKFSGCCGNKMKVTADGGLLYGLWW